MANILTVSRERGTFNFLGGAWRGKAGHGPARQGKATDFYIRR